MRIYVYTIMFLLISSFQTQGIRVALDSQDNELTNESKILREKEIAQFDNFKKAINEAIPQEIENDITTFKAIGYRVEGKRKLSDEEKNFVKKHIDKLALLPFLLCLNFDDMQLSSLPDNLVAIELLRCISTSNNNFTATPAIITKALEITTIPDDINWSSDLMSLVGQTKKETKDTVNMQDFFFAIVEFAMKCVDEKTNLLKQDRWFKQQKAAKTLLQNSLKKVSPSVLAEYMVTLPNILLDDKVPAPLRKKIASFTTPLVNALLAKLNELEKIKVETTILNDGRTKKNKYYGGEAFFSGDLNGDVEQLFWPNKQGFLFFFEYLGLTEDSLEKKLTPSQKTAFLDFKRDISSDIPWIIKEEILTHGTVGVRNGLRRNYHINERKWLKENHFHIPKLTFINNVNLTGIGITRLPASYANMTQLQSLHLNDNYLTEIPEFIFNFDPEFALYLGDNPIEKQKIEEFLEKYKGSFSKAQRTECKKSKLSIKKLKWSKALLSNANSDKLVHYKPALTKAMEVEVAKTDAMTAFESGEQTLGAEINDMVNAHELYANNEDRKKYYANFFFSLINKLSKKVMAKTPEIDDFTLLDDPKLIDQDIDELPFNVWLRLMKHDLCGFLHCFTPYDFIRVAEEKENVINKELAKIKPCSSFAITYLVRYLCHVEQMKIASVHVNRPQHNQTEYTMHDYVGWGDYLTEAPNGGKFRGWFKGLGLAEIMLGLDLVEIDDQA